MPFIHSPILPLEGPVGVLDLLDVIKLSILSIIDEASVAALITCSFTARGSKISFTLRSEIFP
jgi:hypothetical protein